MKTDPISTPAARTQEPIAQPVVVDAEFVAQGPESGPQTPKRKGTFKPGHPRFGGRPKGSPIKRSKEAQAIAEKLGFCVVEWLINIALTGDMQNADGSVTQVGTDLRFEAGKTVAPYLRPKLLATQVTGPNDGPINVVGFDLNRFLESPEAIDAAQKLSLVISAQPLGIEPPEDNPDST